MTLTSRHFIAEDYGLIRYPDHAIWMHCQDSDKVLQLEPHESTYATFRASGQKTILKITRPELVPIDASLGVAAAVTTLNDANSWFWAYEHLQPSDDHFYPHLDGKVHGPFKTREEAINDALANR